MAKLTESQLKHASYPKDFNADTYEGEMEEVEARQWPDLIAIVEEKVKPERATKSKDLAGWPWWRFWRVRSELIEACRGLDEVLVVAQTGNALAFAFKELPMTFSHTVVVFPSESRSFSATPASTMTRETARSPTVPTPPRAQATSSDEQGLPLEICPSRAAATRGGRRRVLLPA